MATDDHEQGATVPEAGSSPETIRDDPALVRGRVEVRDFALVTYRVPPARLVGLIPEVLQPQTVPGDDGAPCALVSAGCFLNDGLRWAGGPSPRLTAHQATYRTYVRHGRELGAFFLASHLGTTATTIIQRLGLADTRPARFVVDVERDVDGGYAHYRSEIEAEDGDGVFHVVATDPPPALAPFRTGAEHVRFITHRLHGYSYTLAGPPVDSQVEHREMTAYGGRLVEGRFPPLDRLGLVPFEAQDRPWSVLVSPGARFDLLPPVPLS